MKNFTTIALSLILISMCAAQKITKSSSLELSWTKSISGQKITGASDLYTISVPTSITTIPFTYEVNVWNTSGTYSKVTEGTTNQMPKVLSFNGTLLINRGQSEPVKLMTTTGTVIVEKIIPASLSVYGLVSETKYLYSSGKLVRIIYTTQAAPSNEYSTKIETFTDSLNVLTSVEFPGMKFVGVAGDIVAGNMGTNGKIISISNNTLTKELTSPITGVNEQEGNLFVLADKLYKLDVQLTEVANYPLQGTGLNFIGDKPVIFNGTSAILYDSEFTASQSTLAVSQVSLVEISSTTDAIYVATAGSLTKIILGTGGNTSGIENNKNTNSIILYPNPTTDKITITGLQNPDIEILNMLGESLISTNQNKIDVSSLPPGVYFCRVNEQIKRFIKK